MSLIRVPIKFQPFIRNSLTVQEKRLYNIGTTPLSKLSNYCTTFACILLKKRAKCTQISSKTIGGKPL